MLYIHEPERMALVLPWLQLCCYSAALANLIHLPAGIPIICNGAI